MFKPIALTLLALASPLLAGELKDEFDGAEGSAPSAETWTVTKTAGPGRVTLDGQGNLLVAPKAKSASQRAFITSKASNFDPFAHPLKIELTGLSLTGDAEKSASNGAFLVVGLGNDDTVTNYYPDGKDMAFGVGVGILKGADKTEIHLIEYTNNVPSGSKTKIYPVNAVPSGLSLTIDGAAKSVSLQLSGAQVVANQATTITHPLSADFTAANLTPAGKSELVSRVSIGAINVGTVATPSQLQVGSVKIDSAEKP